MAYRVPLDIPENCCACNFVSAITYIRSEEHPDLEKAIARCLIAPEEIEDPWFGCNEMVRKNKRPNWCPLEECE